MSAQKPDLRDARPISRIGLAAFGTFILAVAFVMFHADSPLYKPLVEALKHLATPYNTIALVVTARPLGDSSFFFTKTSVVGATL